MIGSITTNVPVNADSATSCVASRSGLSPEERLLALMVYSEMTKTNAAEVSVELSGEKLEHLREQARKALEAAREAQEDAGFWSDVADVLGSDVAMWASVVAIAAASVATGGTAALVLGAIAVGCTLGAAYAKELGLPEEAGIALGIAAALASLAMGNVGGGLSELTTFGQSMRTTGLVASGVALGATAGGAVAGKVAKDCNAEVVDHQADVRHFETGQTLESSSIEENLERLERALEHRQFVLSSGQSLIQSRQQSTQFVLGNFGGMS